MTVPTLSDAACLHGREHFAFLCSTFSEAGMADTRAKIFELGERYNSPIWVSERCNPDLRPGNGLSDLDIIDGCMDAVRSSRHLFLVTTGGFGTHLTLNERRLVSSYIEMELFQGAILEHPIHAIVIGEMDSGSQLARLLAMLERSYPERFRASVGSDNALQEVERVLAAEKGRRRSTRVSAKRLVAALANGRHHDWQNRTLGQEIQFLDAAFDEEARLPDKDRIEMLLRESGAVVGMQRRIARVWLAIRELMGAPFTQPRGDEYLDLWDRALGRWSSYAAWSGLHAHVFLGHLAALGSIHTIRHRMRDKGARIEAHGHTATTDGAFASCYYSLSKIAPAAEARSFLDRSERYVNQGLSQTPASASAGLYAIRGSVQMRRWDFRKAMDDYSNALRISESGNAGDATCGEYLSELGWAEFLDGRFRTGIRHLEQGVALMKNADPGFLVRGLRKLALAHTFNARLGEAYRAAIRAYDLADRHQLNGQMTLPLRAAAGISKYVG